MTRRRILLSIGVCLLAAAAIATGYNQRQDAAAGMASSQLLEQVLAAPERVQDSDDARDSAEASSAAGLSLNPGTEGQIVLGILEIPALEITLPILHDCTPDLLELAPGRFEGSVVHGKPDRLIVAGHNYRTHFKELAGLRVDDALTFTSADADSVRTTYHVRGIITISNDDYPSLTEGEWDLILFTCNFARDKRIVVKAVEAFRPLAENSGG